MKTKVKYQRISLVVFTLILVMVIGMLQSFAGTSLQERVQKRTWDMQQIRQQLMYETHSNDTIVMRMLLPDQDRILDKDQIRLRDCTTASILLRDQDRLCDMLKDMDRDGSCDGDGRKIRNNS